MFALPPVPGCLSQVQQPVGSMERGGGRVPEKLTEMCIYQGLAGGFRAPGGGASTEGSSSGSSTPPAGSAIGWILQTSSGAGGLPSPWTNPNSQLPSPSPPLPPSSQLSQLSSNVADGPTIIVETPLAAKAHSPPRPDSPALTLVTPQLLCPFFDPLFFSNLVASRRPLSPSRATAATKPRRITSLTAARLRRDRNPRRSHVRRG